MQKNRRLLCDLIVDTSKLMLPNASESEIWVHEGGCWHHLRNVCIGYAVTHLSRKLSDLLERYLNQTHSSLRITTSLNDLFRAVKKDFNFSENYPKGHWWIFMSWMGMNNPVEYLRKKIRALGGSRQDLFWEVSPRVFRNCKYYVDFLMERLYVTENLL